MKDQFCRTINLIGEQSFNLLQTKKVVVIGIGGVGGYTCEALARCGVGSLVLIDGDVVDKTNINRQIIALNSTIGLPKVEVMKARILDINPSVNVQAEQLFLTPDIIEKLKFDADYVIDCIDNITAKIALAIKADQDGFNLISCMGTGNKLCPEQFEIADIYKTSVCPLAKVMRKKLKEACVKKLTVLYSQEEPIKNQNRVPSSISFTPSIAGLRIAEFVIKELIK